MLSMELIITFHGRWQSADQRGSRVELARCDRQRHLWAAGGEAPKSDSSNQYLSMINERVFSADAYHPGR